MAVFNEILGVEKAQMLGAGVQNSCQVQIESGKKKAGALIFFYKKSQGHC